VHQGTQLAHWRGIALRAAAEFFSLGITANSERAASLRLPDVLLIIIVLRHDSNLFGNQVCRVESNTELANHGHISTGRERLHEGLGAGTSNCAQVVDQVGFGHADSGINNCQRLVLLIRNKTDVQFGIPACANSRCWYLSSGVTRKGDCSFHGRVRKKQVR